MTKHTELFIISIIINVKNQSHKNTSADGVSLRSKKNL